MRRLVVVTLILAVGACHARPAAPDREGAYRANNTGVAWLEQANYAEAAAAFRGALGIEPALAIAHNNLSLALLYTQDLSGAAREATEAARLMPSAPQPPYVLGLVARADNRPDDALRFFEAVHRIDPRDVGARVNLGQLLLEGRRFDDAIALLRGAVADEPYHVTATYTLGLALTRRGDAVEGRRMLERSQALRATGYGVAFGTGYLEQGHYAEAIASSGDEPDLIDPTLAGVAFAPETLASLPGAQTPPAPFGRPFLPEALAGDGARALARSLGGGLAAIDADADGDLDLCVANGAATRLLRNDSGTWTDATSGSGIESASASAVALGCIAGDYDNDGQPDVFVLRAGGSSLYRNEGGGRFRDVTSAAQLPPFPFLPGAAAFMDVDHDGDLDLMIAGLADIEASRRAPGGKPMTFPRDFAPAPLQLLRNNGNGRFADVTRESKLDVYGHAIAIVPTDFDNRRDVDLLIVYRDSPPRLLKNMRDATFKDVAAEVGLLAGAGAGSGGDITAVTAGDINKDDFPDVFFARPGGGVFALSDGRGGFTMRSAVDLGVRIGAGVVAAQFADYDNDGLLDLFVWEDGSPRLFRNVGRSWSDVTPQAIRSGADRTPMTVSARALLLTDVNGDGAIDAVSQGPGLVRFWRNSGDRRHQVLRVQLKGVVSNRLGIGSKIQLRAGSLSARIETSAATPPVAAVDGLIGLGSRAGADVVRVLWPSGILQTETAVPPVPHLSSPLAVTELNRKPSSCPFLFTWNGTRFEFLTDFMGAGEMGYWEGPGRWNHPSPVEHVRIPGSHLHERDGRFDLRVTNELEEALFADRFELLSIAHPASVTIYPNEGMTVPPKPFRLHAVTGERVPASVVDDHGHDVTDRIARIDRRYPDDFARERVRGYARPHAVTIDAGSVTGPMTLLLTGWTDYAFSSDNRAAHQAGLTQTVPVLEAQDALGRWRTVVHDIGIPVGRPQTIALDLSGMLKPGEHVLRIATNMPIYWDQIRVADTASSAAAAITRLDPIAARLRHRGFSAEVRPDGKEPVMYDYDRVTLTSPWKAMPGRYTREGDVRELVTTSDDRFVIAQPGDEMSLQFEARRGEALPAGWTRTFLLRADGFSKEMDVNSASPDLLGPLPFHAMRQYPYTAPEHYPDTPLHRQYQEQYNTRVVARPLPRLLK